MPKVDLKRTMRRLYFPPAGQPVLVDVPEMSFLMVDGRGDPRDAAYTDAVDTLFAVSFTLKYMVKRLDPDDDYTVMPLESLWWIREADRFDLEDRSGWRWTAMIVQPSNVTDSLVERAVIDTAAKRRTRSLRKIRFDRFREGLAAQMMHLGPYAEEQATVEKLHAFIAEHDYPVRGKHHEIYLSDQRRCAPERMKTVVRQPVGL